MRSTHTSRRSSTFVTVTTCHGRETGKGLDLIVGVGKPGNGKQERRDINNTHRDPGRNEIDLVEEKNEMLVWLLFSDVLLDTATAGTHWVSDVEDMDDDIG